MRRTSKLFMLCAMLLALMGIGTITRTALSDEVEAKARAQALFERGINAYKEGRFKDAIDSFLDAHREYPSPTLSFNAARAYEKMGDNAGALRFYREYLRQTPNASDKARVFERVADLAKKLVARGVQQVTVLSNVTGAQAIIDGKPVGVTPWTGEIAPGKHELKLRQDGYAEAKGEFDLPADHAIDFQLEMKRGAAPATGTGVKDSGSDKPDKDTGPTKKSIGPMTWVAFGVGVGALGGAIVFEQLRKSSEDDVKNEETQVARHDAYDSMKSKQTTARVLAGVGAAAILAGGVLLYFDLSGSSEKTARVAPTPTRVSTRAHVGCGPSSCGAALSGRF